MNRDLKPLANNSFDLLVIGGGIYGAWTAYDASLRGLKVALVDKGDWASGTSSASSKLIHGGLRYLEQFKFGLVRKSLEERERLINLAPHRVHYLRFLIPVYKDSRVGAWKLKAGLWLYDQLAGKKNGQSFHQRLNASKTLDRYPFIQEFGLNSAFTYSDAQTDDFRLTLEILDGAWQEGTTLANYVEAKELMINKDRVSAVKMYDHVDGEDFEIQATMVVNTAGPWVENILGTAKQESLVRLTKGIHLILPAIPCDDALLLTAKSDGRVFFVIPWYGRTLIGTTDTDFSGNPDSLEIVEEEAEYLLSEANRVFRERPFTQSDILGGYIGLRALRNEIGKKPSSVSREWSLIEPYANFIVSIGGKFTSARQDSAVLVDQVMDTLGKSHPKSHPTETRSFPWAPSNDFKTWEKKSIQQGVRLGMDVETATWTCQRYGIKVEEIHERISLDPNLRDRILPEIPFCLAEIFQAVHAEMAVHLDDVLRRRVPLTLLTKNNREIVEKNAAIMGGILNWPSKRQEEEIENVIKKWSPLCGEHSD